MKKIKVLFICFMLSPALLSFSQIRVINNPEFESADNEFFLGINSISIGDEETILYCNTYNLPNYWVKISSQSFLRGQSGKIYKFIRLEGMEVDTKVFMPESGTMSCVLYFEALDKNEQSFDYIENLDEEDVSNFYGIKTYASKSNAPVQCLIKGEVIDRPNSNRLQLIKKGGDERVDGVYIPIRDSKFEYQLNVDIEEAYELSFVDERISGSWRPTTFFAENGTISMKLYPEDRFFDNKIEGGRLNDEYVAYKKLQRTVGESEEFEKEWEILRKNDGLNSPAAKEIGKQLSVTKDNSVRDSLYRCLDILEELNEHLTEEGKALFKKNDELNQKRRKWELEYLKNNTSLVSYFIIVDILSQIKHNPLGPDSYIEFYNTVYKNLYPEHPYTQKIENYIKSVANIKIGGKYIDFTAPDFEGNMITLSEQIKGKVALIDLWASWCGPCRRSSISMIPVYEEYKDKGFTVVGIAREAQLSSAVGAAKKDGYPWLNLVELNDKNKIWEKYGAGNSGGSTFLVDRDGTILAIHPTDKEVRDILDNILK